MQPKEEALTLNRPILLRHRSSGVWIGILKGPGSFPDSITIEGRRIWSWQGGRLECSQLAKQGCSDKDRLGEWETVEIGAVTPDTIELRTIEMSVVMAAKEFAADGE